MEKFIKLHREDNVAIATRNLAKGTIIKVNARAILLNSAIDFGHKIAVGRIKKDSEVLKYGLPIGLATVDISMGQHVHFHNLKSNYFKRDEI